MRIIEQLKKSYDATRRILLSGNDPKEQKEAKRNNRYFHYINGKHTFEETNVPFVLMKFNSRKYRLKALRSVYTITFKPFSIKSESMRCEPYRVWHRNVVQPYRGTRHQHDIMGLPADYLERVRERIGRTEA